MIYLTIVAVAELVVIAAILIMWFVERRETAARETAERRELLTRIQRPELVPVVKPAGAAVSRPAGNPKHHPNRVGTIALARDGGDA